ncbi:MULTISPECIES: HD domain-containing protein [unclassified Campylobacter]|uniref:HD domain-containing protein n=1 Tax=unclassified Campylobacter TaxID=2593542 RepID=UPI0012382215|nr:MULTISPECIES: HD domain-containing protein [unclassified Campylobacter]KAA6227651.1 HD family hydrolase [Campylobacter sp. LR185c]KAA6228853.1 HD family hydrolase [Campylobacter sp. LR286c]KAA6229034.1 HD family hydrolase [Campylobacter sp. LR196d]KAA6233901.1 HD family hydrolase [Campylobacter sp. LR291e]KAA6234002.1 HD family hydrolase [Campylobacter sp. LR264d]
MINVKLIEHIFKAASISRWNDYPRMLNLVELDKQAHKFIIAYFIAKMEKDVNMRFIIEGGIFEFLSRVNITDLRPDVYHQIMIQKKEQINQLVLTKMQEMALENIEDGAFLKRFENYLHEKDKQDFSKERLILKAASYFSTRWEFNIIYQTSSFLNDIDEIKAKVEEELEDYYELIGARKIALNQKIAKIIDLSGRLRFQKRWAQTPRIPETTVLGHMLVVAMLGYFYSLKVKACDKRLENNFYCALFHDLPESLTRDIISPVKYGVEGLDEIISEYEMKLINDRILPFIPHDLKKEFSYILGIRDNKKNEFENRTFKDNIAAVCSGELSDFNSDEYGAIDGKALKCCDRLAALIEAGLSISYGIKSKELLSGFESSYKHFETNKTLNAVNFFELCKNLREYFDIK